MLPGLMDRPVGQERAVLLDELLERQAGQVLHHVVEGAVVRVAVVVDLDGVRVAERGGGLDLALEPPHKLRVTGPVGTDQLDGAGAAQEDVLREIDLAHAPRPQTLLELVLAELAGLQGLLPQPLDAMRAVDGNGDGDQQQEPAVGASHARPIIQR